MRAAAAAVVCACGRTITRNPSPTQVDVVCGVLRESCAVVVAVAAAAVLSLLVCDVRCCLIRFVALLERCCLPHAGSSGGAIERGEAEGERSRSSKKSSFSALKTNTRLFGITFGLNNRIKSLVDITRKGLCWTKIGNCVGMVTMKSL